MCKLLRSETPTWVRVVVFGAGSHIDRSHVVGATRESQLHGLGFLRCASSGRTIIMPCTASRRILISVHFLGLN
jgi:hypothetical protein